MQVSAFCTAEDYHLEPLYRALISHGYQPVPHEDLLHLQHPSHDILFFSYGSVVFWGLSEQEEKEWLEYLHPFENAPLSEIETDTFSFTWGELFRIHQDEIILPKSQLEVKLAASYGIAQSVKLAGFENRIQTTIEKTRALPQSLAVRGKIPLSRKEISQTIGELFIERNSINLHTDILGTPDFFWDNPELEPFYRSTARYLDLRPRVEVLNSRLNIIHELLEILGNELNHQHSSRLEWIIILLILFEVVFPLLKELGLHF